MLSALLGTPFFLYDAHVQSGPLAPAVQRRWKAASIDAGLSAPPVGTILATRDGAVLVECGADHPIWFGHARKPKAKSDVRLSPKLPAVQCIQASSCAVADVLRGVPEWPCHSLGLAGDQDHGVWNKQDGTYQQIWVEFLHAGPHRVAYVYFDFYNGAASTSQCLRLGQAIDHALQQADVRALVLMGGHAYFSNGIALNVIEASEDSALESWRNINAINDVVRAILCPANVITFAALRGNAAAGGLALASACDIVLSSEHTVLNVSVAS